MFSKRHMLKCSLAALIVTVKDGKKSTFLSVDWINKYWSIRNKALLLHIRTCKKPE